jgi:hypothetical protein
LLFGVASVDARGAEAAADWDSVRSPENYTGYERTRNFASTGGAALRDGYLAPCADAEAVGQLVLEPVLGKPSQQPTRSIITLTTCQDLFHSPDRSVGFGHLTKVDKKP